MKECGQKSGDKEERERERDSDRDRNRQTEIDRQRQRQRRREFKGGRQRKGITCMREEGRKGQ